MVHDLAVSPCIGIAGWLFGHKFQEFIATYTPPAPQAIIDVTKVVGRNNYASEDVKLIKSLATIVNVPICVRCGKKAQ